MYSNMEFNTKLIDPKALVQYNNITPNDNNNPNSSVVHCILAGNMSYIAYLHEREVADLMSHWRERPERR